MRVQRLRQLTATGPLAALSVLVVLGTACGEDPGDGDGIVPPPGADDGGDGDGDETGGDGDETGGDGDGDTGGDGDGDGDPYLCDTEETFVESFLTENCGQCHGPDASPVEGGYNWVNDVARLAGGGQFTMGDADGSLLFNRISAGEMPPASTGITLEDEDIQRIGTFIDNCQDEVVPVDPNEPVECTEVTPMDIDEQLELMADDIDDVDDVDRPFTRYLTCAHLAAQGFCQEEINTYVDAIAKMMNSTMVQGNAEEVEAVDGSEGTILRINIQDFEWDEPVAADVLVNGVVQNLLFDDKWDLVSTASPFGYVPDFGNDDAENLIEEAEEIIPFMLCDAFLEIASRADIDDNSKGLYHDLAEIPAQLFDNGNNDSLEELLNFNIQDDVDDRDVFRAGSSESIGTDFDMLAQRHDGGGGEAIWIRFDADGNQAQIEDVRFNPVDFNQVFDNAEIIYTLPNDFPAYMVVDQDGLRLDELDADVFPDPALARIKASDNQVFLSCTGCHGGSPIRPVIDEVLDLYDGGNTPNRDIDEDDVEELYQEVDDFLEQVADDNETILDAYSDVMSRTDIDPVRGSYIAFRADITLIVAASELGFVDEDDLDTAADLDDEFEVLEFGLTVPRDSFEAQFELFTCNVGISDDNFCDLLIGQLDQDQLDQDFADELDILQGN